MAFKQCDKAKFLAKFILIFGCSSAFCKKIVQILMAGENKKISKFGGEIEIGKSYFKGKRGKGEKRYLVYLKKMARFIPR